MIPQILEFPKIFLVVKVNCSCKDMSIFDFKKIMDLFSLHYEVVNCKENMTKKKTYRLYFVRHLPQRCL